MARGPQPAHPVRLTSQEYSRLQHISRLRKAPHGEVVRAKILVAAYEHPDWDNETIARHAGCDVSTVRKWRGRSSREGPQLAESPRPGQKPFFFLHPKSANGRSGLHVASAGGPTLLAVVDSRSDQNRRR